MTEALRLNGFNELNYNEMFEIDGGIDWNAVGAEISGGAGGIIGGAVGKKIGAAIGTTIAPGVGTVAGAIIGAALGVMLYTLFD